MILAVVAKKIGLRRSAQAFRRPRGAITSEGIGFVSNRTRWAGDDRASRGAKMANMQLQDRGCCATDLRRWTLDGAERELAHATRSGRRRRDPQGAGFRCRRERAGDRERQRGLYGGEDRQGTRTMLRRWYDPDHRE